MFRGNQALVQKIEDKFFPGHHCKECDYFVRPSITSSGSFSLWRSLGPFCPACGGNLALSAGKYSIERDVNFFGRAKLTAVTFTPRHKLNNQQKDKNK